MSSFKERILRETLGVQDLKELRDRDFSDNVTPANDAERDRVVRLYTRNIQGSVRLKQGKFYTQEEYRDRVRRVKNLKLP